MKQTIILFVIMILISSIDSLIAIIPDYILTIALIIGTPIVLALLYIMIINSK